MATVIGDIDWQHWKPVDIATLVFIIKNNQLLLIHKKRGLGAGKINAPGGKLNANESIEHCAIRELKEEVNLVATHIHWCGDNKFQFLDGYSMHVHVYMTSKFTGRPIETEEAIPTWCHIDALPYEKMWEDDYLWIPLMLKKEYFSGKYLFNNDKMLDFEVRKFNLPSPPGLFTT